MSEPELPLDAASEVRARFATRPASQSWETIPFADSPQHSVWVWFKPIALPGGFIIQVPDETWRTYPAQDQLTMRKLLETVGVDTVGVLSWQMYGFLYEGMSGATPYFDQAIPAPRTGVDPNIAVHVMNATPNATQQFAVGGMLPGSTVPTTLPATAGAAPLSASLVEIFESIEAQWNAILDIEKEQECLRQQLTDMSLRLKGLNRELTSEERLHASNLDEKDWLEARRCLRDADMKIWSCIKEYDIGDAAINRTSYEQTYLQVIVPRIPVADIDAILSNFAFYRKMATTLQCKMNAAHLHASHNGERRAQQVLNCIAMKVHEASSNRNFFGVVFD